MSFFLISYMCAVPADLKALTSVFIHRAFVVVNTLTLKVSCLLISGLIMQFSFFFLDSAKCVFKLCFLSAVEYQK